MFVGAEFYGSVIVGVGPVAVPYLGDVGQSGRGIVFANRQHEARHVRGNERALECGDSGEAIAAFGRVIVFVATARVTGAVFAALVNIVCVHGT